MRFSQRWTAKSGAFAQPLDTRREPPIVQEVADHERTATCPAPDVDVLETELGVEMCLLHQRTDEVLVLNATAADLWRLLDGATPVETAVAVLATNYGRPAGEISRAVQPLLQDLHRRGFLRPAPQAPP